MIQYIETEHGIDILFNNQCILKHTADQPSFYLGHGKETIDSFCGNFKIEDYIESRIPLKNYTLNTNGITFHYNGMHLEVHCEVKEGRLFMRFKTSTSSNRFWMRLYALDNEYVYGCGEQASYFNLRGRNFPLWTSEPGVGRDRNTLTTFYADKNDRAGGDYYNTYYPETTFVSTRKYWCHLHTFAYADFNFKAKDFHELHAFSVPEFFVLEFADTYLNLLTRLTDYTGRPPQLPEYLLNGMILGIQGGRDTVLTHYHKTEAAGVKVSGLWCQDWAGINYTSFGKRLFWNWTWNQELYPNLTNLIPKLEAKGVHFLAYICPYLLENQSLFNAANEAGYLVLHPDGGPYKENFGEFYSGIVDLTNPKAFNWYKDVIKTNLISLGIKGWMADFGEYLPVDAILHNGVDARYMHNQWPVLWARCNYEALEETGNLGKIFYFMRSGAHGSQKYATALWAGDQSVNWETHDGIPSVIPSALSTAMTGIVYTHSDIGGYTSLHGNIRTKELFERWLEMSVFTAIMRTHESNRPNENFQFYRDEDTLALMARMTGIRVMLKPYIQHLFDEAEHLGYPLQRPLFLHYENDPTAYKIQYQYLFGADVLVAPVITEKAFEHTVYLPNDDWIHLFTGDTYHGGKVTVKTPMGAPAVFYKESSAFKPLFESITEKFKTV